MGPQPSPHFSHSETNALPLNGQQAVTVITALWLWCPTAFRWLQQPIGRHLVIDVAKQVIQRHPEVKNEGIPERLVAFPDDLRPDRIHAAGHVRIERPISS